ncbi:MAG: hypothetical protein ACKVUS_04040 [Saprospiraceae bacterium]
MTNLRFFRIRGRYLLFALPVLLTGTILLLTHSCQKEKPQQWAFTGDKPNLQATDRDGFEVTIPWLQAYQANLATAINGGSMTVAYTTEQMAAGAEALINVATISNKPRSVHQSKVTNYQVAMSSNGQALKDIYNGAYTAYRNHWLSTDTSQTFPVVLEVSIASVVGNTIHVKATSVVGVCNTCLLQNYTNSAPPCDGDAFEEDEAFYVGGGDEELSLLSYYVLPMCNHPCGSTPACQTPPSTAYEQIEARINFNYLANNPPCGPGQFFQGYINITGPLFAQGPKYAFLEEDCGIVDQEIGRCMDADLLNCAYCSFYEQIGVDPFIIPVGKQFISLNLGVNYCFCADFECDYRAYPIAEYTYGCPVCRTVPLPPGWHDPVLANLANLIP